MDEINDKLADILVVDEDEQTRRAAQTWLRREGYDAAVCLPSGLDALRFLHAYQPKYAVLDLTTMGPEGLNVLESAANGVKTPGMTIDYAGESRQIRKEGSALAVTLGFALVLIYLVLAAQFRSFRDPLIVLLGSVPLAISGALLFSFLDLTTINIYSQVGLITLVGLIAKNGILIVQFANKLQEEGTAKLAAIREASLTRLRPAFFAR